LSGRNKPIASSVEFNPEERDFGPYPDITLNPEELWNNPKKENRADMRITRLATSVTVH